MQNTAILDRKYWPKAIVLFVFTYVITALFITDSKASATAVVATKKACTDSNLDRQNGYLSYFLDHIYPNISNKEKSDFFANWKTLADQINIDTPARLTNRSSDLDTLLENESAANHLQEWLIAGLIKEAQYRSQYMIKAAHILLPKTETKLQDDINAPSEAPHNLRDLLISGKASFSEAASWYSIDNASRNKQGELGYFTVFEQPYSFESAAYSTPIGDISEKIETQYGYHIVKILERIPQNQIKSVSHIFLKNRGAQTEARINTIFKKLSEDNFNDLCSTFSEDELTRSLNCELGIDRLIDPLEKVRLQLELGESSSPIKSSLGWHILKVTGSQPIPLLDKDSLTTTEKLLLDTRLTYVFKQLSSSDVSHHLTHDVLTFYNQYLDITESLADEFELNSPITPITLVRLIVDNGSKIRGAHP